MTYYQVTKWRNTIEPVEFSRVTEHCGFGIGHSGRERRVKLHTEYESHFATREEAIWYIHGRLISQKERLTANLADATEQLNEFEAKEQLT